MRDACSKILAIDPGLNGAYAVLDMSGRFLHADELPRFGSLLNHVELRNIFTNYLPEHIVIEKVGAMPKQGVTSVFTFGAAYGMCIGAAGITGAPISFVTPNSWKSHFRLSRRPKDASRELAVRLYPEAAGMLTLRKYHGRADALLMARYALDMEKGAKFT